jgi:hypothetical protein
MRVSSKIKKHLIVFLIFITIYTIIYMVICNHSLSDSMYIAVSTGTFAGATIDIEKDKLTRNVCTSQLMIMYVIVVILLSVS